MTIIVKKSLITFILIISILPLYASVTGSIFNLRTIETEHFDIIYEEGNESTASLIYSCCEEIYSSIVDYYKIDPKLHIPVVITQQYKVLNAYYTSYPANRIVLFDAPVEVGSLSNFPDTLASVFRHELVHAFQFNIRSPFFQTLADAFGDIISLSPMLYMTPALIEGGAVLNESLDGYGRLNDSYAMTIVRQAKLEGLFPSWIDVSGSRDTYPSSLLYYNFAGAFLGYLSLTYSNEAVSSLYVDFGQPNWFESVSSIFKKHIGKSIQEAWNDFYNWVEVPSEVVVSNVLECRNNYGLYSDFFVSELKNIYVYDKSSKRILRISEDLSLCTDLLVSPTNMAKISVLDDSISLLLVPEVLEEKSSVKLLNSDGSRYGSLVYRFYDNDKDFKSGCFVSFDGAKYVLIYSNIGQKTYLDVYDMLDYKLVEGKSIELGSGVVASDFCDIGSSRVAFLINKNAKEYVAILNLKTMEISCISNPIDAQLVSLDIGFDNERKILCFTWHPSSINEASLGYYGEFDFENMTVRLSDTTVTGGMDKVIRLDNKILFASTYYNSQKLCTLDYDKLNFNKEAVLEIEKFTVQSPENSNIIDGKSRKYSPLKYFKDGILIPMGAFDFSLSNSVVGLGATYLTIDPTETYNTLISAGYGLSGPFVGFDFSSSSMIPYSLFASYHYNTDLNSSNLELGALASTSFRIRHSGESISIKDRLKYCFVSSNSTLIKKVLNDFELTYSNYRKTAMSIYDETGYSVSLALENLNPSFSFSALVPRLVPIKRFGNLTLNMPLSFFASIDYQTNKNALYLSAKTNITLIGYEIQKGIRIFGLYFKRAIVDVTLSLGYDTLLNSFDKLFEVRAIITLNPVLGSYLTKCNFNLGVKYENDFINQGAISIYFGPEF